MSENGLRTAHEKQAATKQWMPERWPTSSKNVNNFVFLGGAYQLDERVSLNKTGCFLDDLLSSGECLQLLTARRHLGLICRGLGHALVVQAGESQISNIKQSKFQQTQIFSIKMQHARSKI